LENVLEIFSNYPEEDMYPYNFSTDKFIDGTKIFVAMPFADKYRPIYTDFIEVGVREVNKTRGHHEQLWCHRADEPKYTRSGWIDILQHLFTSRMVIGVLTDNNANVFYELGIAHTTQQIERQILVAPKNYRPKFDLKDLTYIEYNPKNLAASVDKLADSIVDTIKVYDIKKDLQVKMAESRLSQFEFEFLTNFGGRSHFNLSKNTEDKYFYALAHLCHAGLVRLSAKPQQGNIIQYSYYWTPLGIAVLYHLKIIKKKNYE